MERRGRAFFEVMVKGVLGQVLFSRPKGQVYFGEGKRILFDQIRSIRHINCVR